LLICFRGFWLSEGVCKSTPYLPCHPSGGACITNPTFLKARAKLEEKEKEK